MFHWRDERGCNRQKRPRPEGLRPQVMFLGRRDFVANLGHRIAMAYGSRLARRPSKTIWDLQRSEQSN